MKDFAIALGAGAVGGTIIGLIADSQMNKHKHRDYQDS
jgi:outer membrane lipoprotein SlyB